MKTKEYFEKLERDVKEVYKIANEARAKNLDPVGKVEIPLAMSMAEKVVGLISVLYPQMEGSGISERILELEKIYGKLDTTISFQIAEEVARQKFCKFDNLHDAIDAGIRVGFAYQTIAVVASPIEGYTELKIEKTKDDKEYFKVYFSGPIRSAGTTASCVVLMIIDYLREIFGFAKYDPTEEEVKRYVTENTDYHERVTNLQYFPLPQEMEFLAKHLPIQIAGEPTEKLEVSNYKNLERVETNNIRGGMCLIFSEGLAQKAAKGFRLYNGAKKNGLKMSGFDWIEEYLELHEKLTSGKGKKIGDSVPVYIKDIVAGRPIFGHPGKSGAFRFRYGRGRVSGFSATSVHPATMAITDSFIATGTQLKLEKPTKGCVTTPCDLIEGPIVKLFDGSVKRLKNYDEAKKIYGNVEEIIYLGDMLFPFSDVSNRNAMLIQPGYVEEWWGLELREKDAEFEKTINCFDVSLDQAVFISRKYSLAFYPKYIFYWSQISKEQFLELIEWMRKGKFSEKIILPYNKIDREKFKIGKRALELLGIEHDVSVENVVLNKIDSKALLLNLGVESVLVGKELFLSEHLKKENFKESVLEYVNKISKFKIKDKAGEFIGARMGRPEKAKLRKLIGSPNMLFPIGAEGGRLRSLQAACDAGVVKTSFPLFYCENCKKETVYPTCETCNTKTKRYFYCRDCGEIFEKPCEEHGKSVKHKFFGLDIKHYFDDAVKKLGLVRSDVPSLVKGVRGTSSEDHDMEHLSKGIARAMHNLQVNKDGTIRFDATELPIVSFKPKEVFVSIEKLKEIGYTHDINGKELVNDEQILELMPHDVILPSSSFSLDEKADDVFMGVCNFVDFLLERFYGMKPFYNIKKKEDLVGQLGVCMAPHNCAGVICRFIGFSNTLGLFASPYMHAAIRRDCDGDEAAIMLLGDVLMNFSRKFLPGHRGGTQDAPLVLNAKIDAGEVDDQILDFELLREYPLDLYQKAEQKLHSSEVKIETVKSVMKRGEDPFVGMGYTHDTSNFNDGVVCSSYKTLETMKDKVDHQMILGQKIRAADAPDTARLIIERHFIRDLKGNLRKFSMQGFRCVACNEIMRRPPLNGVCSKCGGKIIFTINEGGIKKYLDPALELAKRYNLSNYLQQNLQIIKDNIDALFGKDLEKQESIEKWF